jgi:phage-related baseplate assembly protein
MSRLSVINLAELPPMAAIETIDTEAAMTARMARFKELWAIYDPPLGVQYDVENLEFDPIRINQETCTYFELLLRDRVNQAARDVTLAFGWGSNLDGIASRYPGGVPRLPLVANPRPYEGYPQDWESDDHYRQRIWLSPNLLSPHGTAEAYEFYALTADATMHDARATSDEGTGCVYITLDASQKITPTWTRVRDTVTGKLLSTRTRALMTDPTPTLQQIIDVRTYVHSEGRRGLTDVIITASPKLSHVNYKARVWLYPNVSADLALTSIETALAALIEKQRWIGHDHSRMAIDAALAQQGVHHAVIDEPFQDATVDYRSMVKVDMVDVILAGTTE